ncbi:MAG: LysM peptidoglycan-binding domain-containing protein, partial [Candidatus Hydrogenedentes bacterium]|nr:LysM peptidoglycan-binding domain-containing protein [Candidatus Hydrogenedentota bacterium]
MVISPVVPTTPPELDAVSPPLTLPFRRDSPFLEMLKAATRPVPQANLAPANHRVRSGESLWRICENALKADGVAPTKPEINAAVHRVAAANRLKDANVLAVGQQLDLTAVRVMAPAAGHLESKLDAAG